eukprot:164911-Prymnesium_polylepis.1
MLRGDGGTSADIRACLCSVCCSSRRAQYASGHFAPTVAAGSFRSYAALHPETRGGATVPHPASPSECPSPCALCCRRTRRRREPYPVAAAGAQARQRAGSRTAPACRKARR